MWKARRPSTSIQPLASISATKSLLSENSSYFLKISPAIEIIREYRQSARWGELWAVVVRQAQGLSEEWRKQLIYRELTHLSPLFYRLVDEVLKEESDKMFEFFYLLNPNGTRAEAFHWSHLPDTQGLYYFKARHLIVGDDDPEFKLEIKKTVITKTAKIMISLLNLPIPAMLE